MSTAFVALAERSSARFFELENHDVDSITELPGLSNPDGRLHEGDIIVGSLGSSSHGNSLHTMTTEKSATETVALRFANDVSEMIRRARLDGCYDHAVVIAGPSFLGMIREKLSSEEEKFVKHTVSKNIAPEDDDAMKKHLVSLLQNQN